MIVTCPRCKLDMKYLGGHNYKCRACEGMWWRAPMDSADYGCDVLLEVDEYEQEEEDDAR